MILLRDRGPEFQEAGVETFAISRDSPWSHIAWRQTLDLNFPLLSDWNAEALRAFGAVQNYKGLAEAPIRSAFLVDADGVVRGTWQYETGEIPDFDELLEAARAL